MGATDIWILNYMIHNLTSKAAQVYITYDIDFVPATAPAAASHHAGAPDLDGRRGLTTSTRCSTSTATAGSNGKFTFPDMAKHPYAAAARR